MSVKVHEAFCMDSFMDRLLFFDDFHGDQIQDEWNSGGDAGGGANVIDAQTGGIFRFTTGALANDDWRLHWGNIRSLLVTKKVTFEVRAKLNQNASENFRMALFFDWSNYIWFLYNTTISVNWQIQCADAGAGVAVNTGIAADTNYHIFRIECFPTGQVHFYIDGVETANSPITTNITANYLQPWFYIETIEAVAKTADVDYVYIRQER